MLIFIFFPFRIPILFHPSWRNVFWLKSWVNIAVLGVAGMEEKKLFLFKLSEISKIQPFKNTIALHFQFVTLRVLEKYLQIIEFQNLPSTGNDPTSLFQAPR